MYAPLRISSSPIRKENQSKGQAEQCAIFNAQKMQSPWEDDEETATITLKKWSQSWRDQ